MFQFCDDHDERVAPGARAASLFARWTSPSPLPLRLAGIRLVRDDTLILDGVDFTVEPGTRWLVVGPNGCGKTSLLRIAALYEHPTAGTVDVLGERLGRTDVRELRRRVGFVSAALADRLRPALSAHDVVRTARFAALEPWWHRYTRGRRRAGARVPRPDGRRAAGGSRVRHAVVGRANPRPARPIADERAGDRAPRRAGDRARPGRPRAARGRPLRARRRSRRPRRS